MAIFGILGFVAFLNLKFCFPEAGSVTWEYYYTSEDTPASVIRVFMDTS